MHNFYFYYEYTGKDEYTVFQVFPYYNQKRPIPKDSPELVEWIAKGNTIEKIIAHGVRFLSVVDNKIVEDKDKDEILAEEARLEALRQIEAAEEEAMQLKLREMAVEAMRQPTEKEILVKEKMVALAEAALKEEGVLTEDGEIAALKK